MTLPAGADADGDGVVDYSLTVTPVVTIAHSGSWGTTASETMWAGQFDATLYSYGTEVSEHDLGPLVSSSASLSYDQDFDLTFALGGLGTRTVRGVIDLE
jgi:hypothetical protein